MMWLYYRLLHRPVMRLAHYFNWHYAPPFTTEDGSTQRWCQWCGLRHTTRYVTAIDWKVVLNRSGTGAAVTHKHGA